MAARSSKGARAPGSFIVIVVKSQSKINFSGVFGPGFPVLDQA